MRLLFVLTLATLTACTAAPASLPENMPATPTYGLAGQSVVIQQTQESLALTRAVLDAQSADATQRAVVATAEWQATQSSLSVQQTQAAMRATSEESARIAQALADSSTATARAQSDLATAHAAETATAQAFAGVLMQQAITATGTAIAARASAVETQESAKAQTAVNWQRVKGVVGEAFQWGMLILIFGVIVTALYFAALIGQDVRLHRRQMQHQLLLQAGAETVKATIIQVDGQSYIAQKDGALIPIGEHVTESVKNKAHDSRWRAALWKLVQAGVQLGRDGEPNPFTERALAIEHPVVTHPGTDNGWSDGYRALMDILKGAKVMYAERGKAVSWAKGWDLERFVRDFPTLPLPNLPDGNPPDVRVTLRTYELPEIPELSELPNPKEEQP